VTAVLNTLLMSAAAIAAVLSSAGSAAAAVETFVRFEENAQANWVVVEQCDDGRQARLFISVIGGLEFESPDLDDVNMFVTLLVQGVDCDGTFIRERGTGEAVYTGAPSLQTATVSGTIELNDGSVASIDVQWTGTGPLETTVNPTQFPGFVGLFTNRERDATATGTIILDGATLVSGPSQSADIETLEDRNTRLPSAGG
jgi:hypothetical protein